MKYKQSKKGEGMKNKSFFIIIALCTGLQSNIGLASESSKQNISFGPKLYMNLKEKYPYAPSTYARTELKEGEFIPEGYVKVPESHYRPYTPVIKNIQEGRYTHMGEPRYYQKKLPISAKHEKWNMFIEGYEPKEEFEKRIIMKTPSYEAFKNKARWAKRQEILKSPEYWEQQAKERERLLSLEQQPRIKPTTPLWEQRLQKAVETREQSNWSRFINWLYSIKNSFRSTATISQPRYSSEYTVIENNPRVETSTRE